MPDWLRTAMRNKKDGTYSFQQHRRSESRNLHLRGVPRYADAVAITGHILNIAQPPVFWVKCCFALMIVAAELRTNHVERGTG